MGNPKDSSLVTGKGLPWGPMDTGNPDAPQFEDFNTDPNKFQGPDLTPYRQAMARRIAASGGQAATMARGQLGAAGFGRSGDMENAMTRIAGETAQSQNEMDAGLGLQDWQNKMGLMDAFNRAVGYKNEMKQRRYETDKQAYGQENEQRGSFYGNLLNLGGQLGGAALLGRK